MGNCCSDPLDSDPSYKHFLQRSDVVEWSSTGDKKDEDCGTYGKPNRFEDYELEIDPAAEMGCTSSVPKRTYQPHRAPGVGPPSRGTAISSPDRAEAKPAKAAKRRKKPPASRQYMPGQAGNRRAPLTDPAPPAAPKAAMMQDMPAQAMVKTDDAGIRLKNVFAAPLKDVGDFVAPVHPKSDQDALYISTALADNFVFDSLAPAEKVTLVKAFESKTAKAGTTLITQGETGDYFYILQAGQVAFIVDGVKVGVATEGKSFGDLALLYDSPRAATCKAVEDCTLWRVDQKTFRKILASTAIASSNETRDVLKKVPFLTDLNVTDLNKIVDALTEVHYKPSEVIFKRGDVGDVFYIVKEGKVKVHDIEVGGVKYDDSEYGPGDYFGERAIVTSEPRAATITAVEETNALALSRDVFIKVLGDLGDLVIKAADKRRLKAIPIFARAGLKDFEFDAMAEQMEDMKFKKGDELSTIGTEITPCIVLIREGSVMVKEEGKPPSTLGGGGYFGEETLVPAANNKGQNITATRTIVAVDDVVVGGLPFRSIGNILGGLGRLVGETSKLDHSVKMADLVKHRILGVGTFGQVWLVSKKDSTDDDVFALKIQIKRELLNHGQAEGVLREKNVMASIDHPFIIKLVNTYQDKRCLYMLLRLVQGGELFSVLHTDSRDGVSEKAALFYAAGILEGLAYMHQRKILYRDLKPENVLIDSQGYPVIVDLGFAKVVEDKTYTLCGTPLYLAPEVILSRGHDKGCDYWSWAVMVYEMCIGNTCFYENGLDQIGLFKRIVKGKYNYPPLSSASAEVRDLIKRCLILRSSERLGNLRGGSADIKGHPWFNKMEWDRLVEKGYKAPWAPQLKNALDSSNFDNWDHMAKEVDPREKKLTSKEQDQFKGF